MTDADIARLVAELDKRKTRAEVASIGGIARHDNSKPPHGGKQATSAADTAAIIGVSARKVERTRAVQDKATPEAPGQNVTPSNDTFRV